MSDKTEINLLDDEYMTPQQRAELRKTMTELPLWAESAQPATYVRMSDTELHRAINGTTGMESEE